MEIFPLLLIITLCIILLFAFVEIVWPGSVTEGFENLPKPSFWSTFLAPRADIDFDKEDPTLIRDPRYFNSYANIQRIGQVYDFCRVVSEKEKPENKFVACALAGTDMLDSTKFRSEGTEDGFRLSYDDYMRDIDKDGRDDYCRILKWKDGSWQAVCNRATDIGFERKEVVDSDPPEEIQTLLRFYQDCVLWLRLTNTMEDFVGNVQVQIAGGVKVDESKSKEATVKGVEIFGNDQFLRLSDSPDLTVGEKVPLRSVRAWMVWVYFDEFTNNAKIFDFGNGPGRDNVFLGILGKGDTSVSVEDTRPLLCGKEDSTLPTGPSGAQPVSELSPQDLMKTSDANVDEFVCTGFDTKPRKLEPSLAGLPAVKRGVPEKATLLYEVWDKQSRKMRLKVPGAIPLKKWVHICVTATSDDGFRPNMAVYVDGKKMLEKESGWLPATSSMNNCYIGKSNWFNAASQYETKDEGFRGKVFDFRAYRRSVKESLVNESFSWGQGKLELNAQEE